MPQQDLTPPISRILTTIEEIDPLLSDGALVTDAGSTKAEIALVDLKCDVAENSVALDHENDRRARF